MRTAAEISDGIDRQRLPIAQPQLLESLEQAAIDQDLVAAGLEQVLGAGHRARRPHEGELCHNVSSYGTAFRLPAARSPPCSAWRPAAAAAQTKPLTVEEIYSYEGWRRFNGSQAAMMTWVPAGDPWLSDTHHLWPAPSEADGSAQSEPQADAARGCASTPPSGASRAALYLRAARARARRRGRRRPTTRAARRGCVPSIFNATRDAFLVTIGDDLYVYNISTQQRRG